MSQGQRLADAPDKILMSGTNHDVIEHLFGIFQVEYLSRGNTSDELEYSETFHLEIIEDDLNHSERSVNRDTGSDESVIPRQEIQPRSPSIDFSCGESDSGDQTPWTFSLTARFAKSASRLDKKLQGRILAALLELGDAPDIPHGDTIKPLEGRHRGDWRYRIGDYRLIYRPDRYRREVLLLEVAPRGDAYA